MNKNKKILWITIIALDVLITLALFAIHIYMLVSLAQANSSGIEKADMEGLAGFLANNMTLYGLGFVVPLFVILAFNVVGLVVYMKRVQKENAPKKAELNDLSDEEKEALKRELLKDLMNEQKSK